MRDLSKAKLLQMRHFQFANTIAKWKWPVRVKKSFLSWIIPLFSHHWKAFIFLPGGERGLWNIWDNGCHKEAILRALWTEFPKAIEWDKVGDGMGGRDLGERQIRKSNVKCGTDCLSIATKLGLGPLSIWWKSEPAGQLDTTTRDWEVPVPFGA